MDINEIETRRKAAALELEGLNKLAEAHRMKQACGADCACGGAPQAPETPVVSPAQPARVIAPVAELGTPVAEPIGAEQPGIIVMPARQKLASIELLDKVADELEKSEDPEIKKLAMEVDTITDLLDKVAHVYEYDYNDPEKEMKDAFSNKIVEKQKDEPYMDEFKTDKSHEVAKALKDGRLYAKVEGAHK